METLKKLLKNGISLTDNEIGDFCQRYKINELSVFGSSIRDDFNQNSDIDFLVSFSEDSEISLFDIIDLENELRKKLNREIDIVEKESLKNPIRKKTILETSEVLYAAE
jgi:hypothetical protein